MKVLVDAQLPKKLVDFLLSEGVDAIHTFELNRRNRTPDDVITNIAEIQNRIVITKDIDFFDSFILTGKPSKLLLVTTGNITNKALLELFINNLDVIDSLFENNSVVELSRTEIVVHY